MRITAVAGNCRRGLPGWAALVGMVMLAAVTAGLAAGGRPVQAAVRHLPGARTLDTISPAGELGSVSAVSPADVWVAGVHDVTSKDAAEPLVLHWNGTTWMTLKTPVFAGRVQTSLDGLSALSPTDAWVAGYYGIGAYHPLILHCNGTACQQVTTPILRGIGTALYGVSAVSPTDVWVAGAANGGNARLMLHWNGQAWMRVATPAPSGAQDTALFGVSADSPTDAWAAGSYLLPGGTGGPMMLHWNGNAWTLAKAPAIGGAPLGADAISAVSPTDVWAAGTYSVSDQAIVRWDGKTWTQMKIPAICETSCLYGVSAVSPTDAWTAGSSYSTGPYKRLILHCNGTACTRAKSPVLGQTQMLFGVSADSPIDAWAVGGYGSGKSLDKVLILHWDGTTWTQVSPTGS